MRTILWWAVWGLVVSIGIIGLLERGPHHLNLLAAIPLLTGAIAAGLIRVEHEYRHAIEHAKWVGVSALFLIVSLGFVYVKGNAVGPFATGTKHKAILGTTFGMSVPEVERVLGRRLAATEGEEHFKDQAHQWVLDALPTVAHPLETRYAIPLTIYQTPGEAAFYFYRGKLGKVQIAFDPRSQEDISGLRQRLQRELAREYRDVKSSPAGSLENRLVFSKDAVEAVVTSHPAENGQMALTVTLKYEPTTPHQATALAVEANLF